MSEASKRARAERRGRVAAGILTPEVDEHEDEGPVVHVFGVWAVPGQGWQWCEAALPMSLVLEHAVTTSPADILPITLAKLDEAIAAHAGKGVVG
jgi:hypothetical protein